MSSKTAILASTVAVVILAACSVKSPPAPKKALILAPPSGRSSLNGTELGPEPSGSFRFIVGGHLYGRPGLGPSRPSPNFVARIDDINSLEPEFLVSLGDCFFGFKEPWIEPTRAAFRRLDAPVFNAIGNHDATDREAYRREFGPTWFAFDRASVRIVVLDSELTRYKFTGEQRAFIENIVTDSLESSRVRSVFFFAHHIVYATHARHWVVGARCNAMAEMQKSRNPWEDPESFVVATRPLLRRLAKSKSVYWFAGDIGAFANLGETLFCEEAEDGITWLASGIGDYERDLLVVVDVAEDGGVTLSSLALKDGAIAPIENRGYDFWLRNFFPDGVPDFISERPEIFR